MHIPEKFNRKSKDAFEDRNVLVTGGAGFVGSHLVEALVDLGAKVTAVDNLSTGSLSNLSQVIGQITFIFDDILNWQSEGPKFDFIFHQAAVPLLPSFANPQVDLLVNARGTLRVLECARVHDSKLVYASTGSVYGNPEKVPIPEDHSLRPISPYGVSKLSGEMYVSLYYRIYGLKTVSLRYFNVYGPRQVISEQMGVIPIFVNRVSLGKDLMIFGDGKQTRDFTHIHDVVAANLAAALHEDASGLAINIGSGRETSILELAKIVRRTLGTEGTKVTFGPPKPGDIRRLCADVSLAAKVLGYKPHIRLEDGMSHYVATIGKGGFIS